MNPSSSTRVLPVLTGLLELARTAGRTVLPVQCAGCGAWDTAVCERCLSLLQAPAHPVDRVDAAGDLEVLALARYAGPVRSMVLGWKSGRRQDLAPVMAQAGSLAGRRWAAGLDAGARAALGGAFGLLVVPAPSGLGRRMRGLLVAADLADAVARGVAEGLAGEEGAAEHALLVASADVLRRASTAPRSAHQAGRSSRARRRNRATPPRVLAPVAGWAVLLVDDVVTTGATLGACARALEAAGAQVLGALALAAPPAPSGSARVPGPMPHHQPGPPATEGQMKQGPDGASSEPML